ncbi:MAG: hypothetical protein Q7S79_04010 [bacterium]|nr:hypothetical protein [bacterium]
MARAENLIGRTSAEVLSHLAQTHPEVATFTLGYYECMFERGSSGRHLGMSHWEEVPRAKVIIPGWAEAAEKLLPGENQTLAICSRVRLIDGTNRHIPMLDVDSLFPCYDSATGEFTERGQDEVLVAAKKLEANLAKLDFPSGYILHSGHGLHFIGLQLVDETDFHPLADLVQMEIRNTDGNWAGYAQDYEFFALRLNVGQYKFMVPRVVLVFQAICEPTKYKQHLNYTRKPSVPWWRNPEYPYLNSEKWDQKNTENPIFSDLPDQELNKP